MDLDAPLTADPDVLRHLVRQVSIAAIVVDDVFMELVIVPAIPQVRGVDVTRDPEAAEGIVNGAENILALPVPTTAEGWQPPVTNKVLVHVYLTFFRARAAGQSPRCR